MATATMIDLQEKRGIPYHQKAITTESSTKASELLQDNHERHHMFFNGSGFHNHIAHALLTLYVLGAPPQAIQRAYERNKVFQRPQLPADKTIVGELQNDKRFLNLMGDERNYSAFLAFFQQEIARTSWQKVLQEYVFAGDERADAMFVRLFDSFLHPVIHLGFGVEFGQPSIIAEALAQTACHEKWIGDLLLPAERASAGTPPEISAKSMVELLDAVHADGDIRNAPHWDDEDKIRNGLLGRAKDRMIAYIAQVHVAAKDLHAKNAEMTNAVAYFTAGAQRRDKVIKFDFYLIHSLTSSIFFSTFLEQPWLGDANKVRLLEWKIRTDIIMYASRKSPEVCIQRIRDYRPKRHSDWNEIADRVCVVPDDGHASKLIRAIAHGQQICKPYEAGDAFRVKHDDWYSIALMAIDSVEIEGQGDDSEVKFDGPGQAWVRSAGFDQAWEDIPARV